ncbi:MAG TPA: energy transducer TonB [Xanthobacteraceae bacterium]|jgi:protein TonB
MSEVAAEGGADLRRWIISAAIVMLAHGAVAGAMLPWREASEPDEPAAAIVVDFSPIPVAPATLKTEIPPGPEQVMSDASPDKPVQAVKETIEPKPEQKQDPAEEPPPEITPAPNPDVPIQPPQELKQEITPQQEPRPPAPTTSAPQAAPLERAAVPAAPAVGRSTPKPSNVIPSWATRIAALLERNKRYPSAAQARGEHGIAQVSFSLDRQGHVIESRITRSSGAPALDEEALALLRRSQPFPAPPRELAGAQVNLTVPIRFNLR